MSKHFPQLKLSTRARRDLKKLKPVVLKTTLITEKGPAVGTIWQGSLPEAMIVKSVENDIVQYEDDGWDHLPGFMGEVEAGRYILIGACHPIHSYVPHVVT